MKNVKTVFSFALMLILLAVTPAVSALTEIPAGVVSSYDMNTAGETYVLAGDVTATGTAFIVGANDIIFDGNGYTVSYATTSEGKGIIATGRNNITIQDVEFNQSDITQTGDVPAVYLSSCTNSFLINCIGHSYASYGIFLSSSTGNTLTDSTGQSETSHGLFLYNSANNNDVSRCTGTSQLGYGTYIYSSTDNTFTDCNGQSNSDCGISIDASADNILTNCTGISSSSRGIYLEAATTNILTLCTGESTSNHGILLYTNSNNNSFTSCTGTSGTNFGLYLHSASGNTFFNCTGQSSSGRGILLETSSNTNNLSNCTGMSDINYGMYLESSANNILSNCIGLSNEGCGVYVVNLTATNFSTLRASSIENIGLCVLRGEALTFNNILATSTDDIGIKLNQVYNSSYADVRVQSRFANTAVEGSHILVVGDSITEGISETRGGFCKFILVDGASISDQGVGGDKASLLLPMIDDKLNIFNPDIVVIAIGVNDIGDSDEASLISNIITIADHAQASGATPYICSILPYDAGEVKTLNHNLSTQAQANGYTFINTYDAVDSAPQNDIYDNYVSANYHDGVHPTDTANALIGGYISRNIFVSGRLYKGLNSTIYSSGRGVNSRCVHNDDTPISFTVTPADGDVTVNVTTWEANHRVWTESSETHNATTQHTIGGFPANAWIDVNCDGALYTHTRASQTGHITWVYSGGYSEHTFEALVSSHTSSAGANINGGIWQAAIGMIVVATIITVTGLVFRVIRGRLGSDSELDSDTVTGVALGMVSLCVIMLMGAIVLGVI